MRLWGINPKILCRNHLLGEHKELHYMVGWINGKKPLILKRWSDKMFIDTTIIIKRHKELVDEMVSRGYNHKSPLPEFKDPQWGSIDAKKNKEDLLNRCSECKKREYFN